MVVSSATEIADAALARPRTSEHAEHRDVVFEWSVDLRYLGSNCSVAPFANAWTVKDNPGFYDAAVWVLDPFDLNRRAIGREEVIPPSASGVLPGEKRLVDPWLPPRFKNMAGAGPTDRRVSDSHRSKNEYSTSCFTVHGMDAKGLDKLQGNKNGCLVKITIPSFRVQAIRRELEASGIDEVTIFPDLAGLSRSLALKWKSDAHHQPHEGVYTRLRPSGIHKGGVGVFAIRRIKKETLLFEGDNEGMLWVEGAHVPKTPDEIRKLYEDFPVIKGGRYGCPPTFNRLTVAWYLNEPRRGERPNVGCNDAYDFFALCDINAGEELTVDYSTYSESPIARPK